MEYRVKIEEYPNGSAKYTPQAKICLFWRNIGLDNNGCVSISGYPLKFDELEAAKKMISALKNKKSVNVVYVKI